MLVETVPLMPLFAFFPLKLQDGPCGSEKEFCKKFAYCDYPIEGMFCVFKDLVVICDSHKELYVQFL